MVRELAAGKFAGFASAKTEKNLPRSGEFTDGKLPVMHCTLRTLKRLLTVGTISKFGWLPNHYGTIEIEVII